MKTILYAVLCVMLLQACMNDAKKHQTGKRLRNARSSYGYGSAPAPQPIIPQQKFKSEPIKMQSTYQQQLPQQLPQQAPVRQTYSAPAPPQLPTFRQESSYQQQQLPQQLPLQVPQTYASVVRQPELPREEPKIELPREEPKIESYGSVMRQEPIRQESYGSVLRQPELPREEPKIELPRQESYGSVMRQEPIRQEPIRQESYGSVMRQEPIRQEPVRQESYGSVVRQQPQQYGQRTEQPIRQSQSYGSSGLMIEAEKENRCSIGVEEPMWTENRMTSFYCRCPSGTYGITCTENFANPCTNPDVQYSPADSSLGKQHFLECSNSIPHLFKCPASLEWSQEKLTCDFPPEFYAALEELVRRYNEEQVKPLPQQAPVQSYQSYQQAPIQQQQQFKSAPVKMQSYGSYGSSY